MLFFMMNCKLCEHVGKGASKKELDSRSLYCYPCHIPWDNAYRPEDCGLSEKDISAHNERALSEKPNLATLMLCGDDFTCDIPFCDDCARLGPHAIPQYFVEKSLISYLVEGKPLFSPDRFRVWYYVKPVRVKDASWIKDPIALRLASKEVGDRMTGDDFKLEWFCEESWRPVSYPIIAAADHGRNIRQMKHVYNDHFNLLPLQQAAVSHDPPRAPSAS